MKLNISAREFKKAENFCADRQRKQIASIYDAMEGGCNLFNIDDLIAENSKEEFEQLFLCQFADDNSSAFKFSGLATLPGG